MKIIIYTISKKLHQDRAKAFCNGLKRHGYEGEIHPYGKVVPCDLAVFWGMFQSKNIRALQKKNNKDFLVMEAGFVGDRSKWVGLGYNGLNGYADFLNEKSDQYRWQKYFPNMLKPWKANGEYVLVTGQVTGDASLEPVGGRVNYQKIVDQIKQLTPMPVYYRRHPHKTRQTAPCPRGAKESKGTLEEALSKAHVVVTFNSNTSVDSILNGVPCVVLDKGSMAWDVSNHHLNRVNNPERPRRFQWMYNISYAQWTKEEIENGDAWEHLKNKYK